MKMTDADERALAAIEDAIRTSSYGAFAPGRTALIEARDHIRARLAADQQKGGGEVAEYQSQVTDKTTGKVVHPWSHCGRAAYDAAKGQPHEGTRLHVEYRKLYTTPKPSIPAPAQQDGKVSGGEVDDEIVVIDGKRYAVETVRTALLGLAVDLARELAHPPHADQETQP